MSLADQLREFVARHFFPGHPRGYNLLELADQIERIESDADPHLLPDGSTSWGA